MGRAVLGGKFTEWEITDFNVDAKGNLLLVEAATTLDAIPVASQGFES
jgi:hypothetical protein